jgi:threonylcarbamoyladenosine tRNA methylthiotransferase MtaB
MKENWDKIKMRAAFFTLGCKTNSYDTQAMIKILKDNEIDIVDFKEQADIYIINTCAVTNISEAKSRQAIRRAHKLNPNALIVAAGCYSQINPSEIMKLQEVDAVIGNKDRLQLFEIINKARNKKMINVTEILNEHYFEPLQITSFSEKTRAFIKIQEGCNNFCSYCIIPYARGPARSRDMQEIKNEVHEVIRNGHKEIILTGIHIASYGIDKSDDKGLIDLIEELHIIDGLKRIRLGSLEPKILSEEFLKRLTCLDKVCPAFHISLQSGCDKTLKNMNRKYTSQEYFTIIKNVKKYFPSASLTTDIIVGFPMESEEDFEISYEFCKKIEFMKIHVFPYSRKKGTAAAAFNPQIDKNIIQKRCEKFLELSDSLQDKFNILNINKIYEVLFEKNNNGINEGYTNNYIFVKVQNENDFSGQIHTVRLTENKTSFMNAKIIN